MEFFLHHTRMPRHLDRALLGAALALAAALPAQAADALNGKTLYLNGPVSGGATCASCHGASPAANVNGILKAANTPTVISAAFAANKGGMGTLFNGKFSASELADLAAFIGNPAVTAAPAASLTPASLVFSGTTLGQTSAALSATLANTGNAALNIDTIGLGGAAAAEFALSGGSCAAGTPVAAGANCSIQVTFKPSSAGTRTAALNIAHNATGGLSTVSLSGTGNAVAQATVGVSATSLNFGALVSNTASAVQTVTVSNSGQAALNFSAISLGGANSTVFTLGGSCAVATPVAAGASCTVTVQAKPTAAGAFAGNLTLASNAANGNVTVGLSGTGAAASATIAANPSAVAFGAHTVGAAALTQNVTLTNTGNVAVTFTSIAVSGGPGVTVANGGTCNVPLAAGASCVVPLAFAPAAEGNVTATLLAKSNAPDVSVGITASGTTAPVAKPTLSDAGPINFADTQVGKTSAAGSTTLRNPGTAAMKIATLSLGGANAADFVLGGTCAVNATVNAGGSCSIDITFKPGAAGARTADLVIVSDGGTQLTVRLAGNGVAIAATPTLTVAPQTFDFGAATIGATAPTKRFSLSNTGTAAVNLSAATFSGPFARVADATGCAVFPFTLQPGAACDLVVSYTPATAGASSGSVAIAGDAGASWTIALAGQGNAVVAVPSTPAAIQNQGGGGCSSIRDGNDPTLPVLAVLALGVVLVRRRSTAK